MDLGLPFRVFLGSPFPLADLLQDVIGETIHLRWQGLEQILRTHKGHVQRELIAARFEWPTLILGAAAGEDHHRRHMTNDLARCSRNARDRSHALRRTKLRMRTGVLLGRERFHITSEPTRFDCHADQD